MWRVNISCDNNTKFKIVDVLWLPNQGLKTLANVITLQIASIWLIQTI